LDPQWLLQSPTPFLASPLSEVFRITSPPPIFFGNVVIGRCGCSGLSFRCLCTGPSCFSQLTPPPSRLSDRYPQRPCSLCRRSYSSSLLFSKFAEHVPFSLALDESSYCPPQAGSFPDRGLSAPPPCALDESMACKITPSGSLFSPAFLPPSSLSFFCSRNMVFLSLSFSPAKRVARQESFLTFFCSMSSRKSPRPTVPPQ